MKKAIPAILACCIFISVGGYTIPCTLHCLNMESDMEMCHHEVKSDAECEGSCMVNTVDDNVDGPDASHSNDMLLTQYRVHLTAVDTISSSLFLNPLSVETYLEPLHSSLFSPWIPDPVIPPPQMLLSV
ncbi:hypothetical protein [Fodinibius sp. Rm-B-1B1-1]|uniref:hypothetical protein n=1 Tax=Fodinibius alkaliphilus TaxID=3140241 RepID=UPI00315B1B92